MSNFNREDVDRQTDDQHVVNEINRILNVYNDDSRRCTNVREYNRILGHLLAVLAFRCGLRLADATNVSLLEFLGSIPCENGELIVRTGRRILILSPRENEIFLAYVRRFRPSEQNSSCGKLLVTMDGNKVANSRTQLRRYQKDFGLPPVTVRRLYSSLNHPPQQNAEQQPQRTATVQNLYRQLKAARPVTVNGKLPIAADVRELLECPDMDAKLAKRLVSRWRDEQTLKRAEHVASSIRHRPHSADDVSSAISRQHSGWASVKRTATEAMKRYSSPERRHTKNFRTLDDIDDIAEVINGGGMWPGTLVVLDLPGRGRGVIATRTFEAGEVVCHYNGELLDEKTGKERYELEGNVQSQGYMFTFRSNGRVFWRDATEEQPGPGRLINHSRCHANVKTTVRTINDEPHLIMTANQRIVAGQEFLLDYNDKVSKAEFLRSCPVCRPMQ